MRLVQRFLPSHQLIVLKVKKSSSKKKKHSRGDQFDIAMDGVMKEQVSAQERNEKLYLELEQKG